MHNLFEHCLINSMNFYGRYFDLTKEEFKHTYNTRILSLNIVCTSLFKNNDNSFFKYLCHKCLHIYFYNIINLELSLYRIVFNKYDILITNCFMVIYIYFNK